MDLIVSTHMIAQNDPGTPDAAKMEQEEANKKFQKELASFKTECNGRTFLQGLAVAPLTFAGTYFFLLRMVHVPKRATAAAGSMFFGAAAAYFMVKQQLVECEKGAKQREENFARNMAIRKSH